MVKLFTHTDLDGIGCAILAKIIFNNLDIEYCGYDSINRKVDNFLESNKDYDICFITDISVSNDIAKKVNNMLGSNENRFKQVYLLDHHNTALSLNKYNWCTVIEEIDGIKTCGTSLFYQFLSNHYNFPDQLRKNIIKFVNIVRNYDTWAWKDLDEYGLISKKLNDLLKIYGRDAFIENVISKITSSNDIVFFNMMEKELLESRQKEINEYIKEKDLQLITQTNFGYKYGIVFADRFISELGNTLCILHPEIDFIAIIDMGNMAVSYRTIRDDINLGTEIASLYGGGGHPKAAGSKLTKELYEILYEAIKERMI